MFDEQIAAKTYVRGTIVKNRSTLKEFMAWLEGWSVPMNSLVTVLVSWGGAFLLGRRRRVGLDIRAVIGTAVVDLEDRRVHGLVHGGARHAEA